MMQSLSPQETSQWCASLAPCGVRGEMLGSLQASLMRHNIDGKRFDDLLKANGLHELCVDGLNARLGVAMRRAWKQDFEHVTFISHAESQLPQPAVSSGSRPSSNPPPHEQRVRSADKRAAAFNQPLITVESFAARNLACRLKAPPSSDFYEKGLDNYVAPNVAAPISMYASDPKYGPHAMYTAPSYHGSPASAANAGEGLGDVFRDLSKQVAPTSFAAPQMYARPPRPRDENAAGGLDDIFAPKLPAPTSFAAPEMHAKPARPASDGNAGDLGDIFAARPPAPTSFAAPVMHAEGRHGRRQRQDNCWEGVSLGDALSSAKPAEKRFSVPEQTGDSRPSSRGPTSGRRRPRTDDCWAGVGLGDALGPRPAVRHTYSQEDAQVQNGSSLQQEQYAQPSAPSNGWDGVSLGDATQRAPPSAMQHAPAYHSGWAPDHAAERAVAGVINDYGAAEAPTRSDDPWGGMALGDAVGKKEAAPRTGVAAPIDWSKEPRRGGRRGGEVATSNHTDKSSGQILEWLKTLPDSHVPEKTREEVAAKIEEAGMDGGAFTTYVQTIPPEICAPKHAMKLKAAWKNVLAEAAHCVVANQNLDAASKETRKAVAVKM